MNNIEIALNEDIIRKEAQKRSSDDVNELRCRRGLSVIINLFILIFGFGAIYFGAYVGKEDVEGAVKREVFLLDLSNFHYFKDWAP